MMDKETKKKRGGVDTLLYIIQHVRMGSAKNQGVVMRTRSSGTKGAKGSSGTIG